MSRIVGLLNQNSNEFILATDLAEIKTLLAQINGAVGGSQNESDTTNDNLFLQYPESTADMTLASAGTFTREISLNRKLKQMCYSVPSGVYLTVYNNNQTFAWLTNEAGQFDFDSGITFGTMKINVQNTGADAARWTCKLSFK